MSVNTSKPNIKLSVADTVEEAIKNFAGSLELNAKVSIYARNSFKIGVSGKLEPFKIPFVFVPLLVLSQHFVL
jgi:hypothetical protein